MRMFKFFCLSKPLYLLMATVILSCTLTPSLHASEGGDGPGNGGDAVMLDGKPYLLDFVEAGIERTVNVDQKVDDFRQRPKEDSASFSLLTLIGEGDLLNGLDSQTRYAVAAFLWGRGMSIEHQGLLVAAISAYRWRLVTGPLRNVGDERSSIDLSAHDVRQLAVRRDQTIMIDRALWEQMNLANRVGLVIHEALYALQKPIRIGGKFAQESWTARQMTAYFFSDEIFFTLGQFRRADGTMPIPVEALRTRMDDLRGAATTHSCITGPIYSGRRTCSVNRLFGIGVRPVQASPGDDQEFLIDLPLSAENRLNPTQAEKICKLGHASEVEGYQTVVSVADSSVEFALLTMGEGNDRISRVGHTRTTYGNYSGQITLMGQPEGDIVFDGSIFIQSSTLEECSDKTIRAVSEMSERIDILKKDPWYSMMF